MIVTVSKQMFIDRAASVKMGSKPPFAAVGVRVRFGPVAYHRLVGIALSNDGTAFGTTIPHAVFCKYLK